MGGLSRRANVIRQNLNEADKPVLILDAGALLFDLPVLPPSQLSGKKEQAEGIMQAMRSMQYNAIGVAPQDLSAGIEFLEHLQDTYTIPFISANLVRQETGEPVFKPFIIQQVGDLSVAILGMTGIDTKTLNNELLSNVSILPWQETIRKTLTALVNSPDMIVLLSNFPEQINIEIAQQFNEINLILQSGHSSANRVPYLKGKSLLTQTASRGKYLGSIDIHWTSAKKWHQDNTPRLKTSRDRLDRINWRLGRLEKRNPGKNLSQNVQYRKLQTEKASILKEIADIQQLEQQESENLSTYNYRAIPLKIALPEDPEVRSILADNKKRVNEINKIRMEELRQKTSKANILSSMAGWKSCQTCHAEQTEFWKKTDHAKAWDTLNNNKQQFNQDCLICHVTLPTYDRNVVFRDNLLAALTPEFKGVSCEACHGPARKHTEQPEQNRPLKPTVQTCLTCHTPDRDDNFDFDRKVKMIRCPASKT